MTTKTKVLSATGIILVLALAGLALFFATSDAGASSVQGEGQLESYYSQMGEEIETVAYTEHADGHIVKVNDEDFFFISQDRFAPIESDNHVLIGMSFEEGK